MTAQMSSALFTSTSLVVELNKARKAYAVARKALGMSNKMGTTLNRSVCFRLMNKARNALIASIRAVEGLLGRKPSSLKKTKPSH